MTILKYIGTHQPQGMLIDVKENQVEKLLDTGEYKLLKTSKTKPIKIKSEEIIKDDNVIKSNKS